MIALEKGRNHLLALDPPFGPAGEVSNDESKLMRRHFLGPDPLLELSPFVARLARRIASFPPDGIRLAKQAVDAALPSPVGGLLVEAHAWNQVLTDPAPDARFEAAIAAGARSRDGARDLPLAERRRRDAVLQEVHEPVARCIRVEDEQRQLLRVRGWRAPHEGR